MHYGRFSHYLTFYKAYDNLSLSVHLLYNNPPAGKDNSAKDHWTNLTQTMKPSRWANAQKKHWQCDIFVHVYFLGYKGSIIVHTFWEVLYKIFTWEFSVTKCLVFLFNLLCIQSAYELQHYILNPIINGHSLWIHCFIIVVDTLHIKHALSLIKNIYILNEHKTIHSFSSWNQYNSYF